MLTRSVADKLGIKEGMRAIFKNAPEDATSLLLQFPIQLLQRLSGVFDYIHLFVITQEEFKKEFPKCKKHLKTGGMLWVSWPKSGKKETDLAITSVIKIGYDFGLVESKCISINDTWSALKFTHPKKDKKYNNSYGDLGPGNDKPAPAG